jgi:hypothetical protein
MNIVETEDIKFPLSSENLKTYVIPLLGHKKKIKI